MIVSKANVKIMDAKSIPGCESGGAQAASASSAALDSKTRPAAKNKTIKKTFVKNPA